MVFFLVFYTALAETCQHHAGGKFDENEEIWMFVDVGVEICGITTVLAVEKTGL